MFNFQKALIANKKLYDKKKVRLEKDCKAVCERLCRKEGRSVMLLVVDKCGSSIFGQEYVKCGFTAHAEGALPEFEPVFNELMQYCREHTKVDSK